jgi:GT2 family glycosyltransferase
MMVKRNILKELNGFNENLFCVEEDKDLSFRIRKKGRKIIYCPFSYVIHDRTKDDLYDRMIRYDNIPRIKKDIGYFESRWNCKVELIYSTESLKMVGYSDDMVNNIMMGDLKDLFTII